jgi:Holliday junction resolvasome RuvABC ATP-dependent DNA helicase subunit
LDEISGTTGLAAVIDAGMVLRRDSRGTTLSVRGRDIAERELAMTFDKQSCRWHVEGEADEVRLSEERKRILEVLEEAGEPVGIDKIAGLIDKKRNAVEVLLHKMMKDGQVERVGKGRYSTQAKRG